MALPVKDFIIQQLLEFDPNFDVGSGVPTTSLLIDPLSVILQPIVDELTVAQASQSILTILESSDPDAFPEDIVDGLASNAFVDRNPGSIGSDVERIRFFEPQDFSYAQGILVFRGPGGQRYTNSESVSVTAAEVSLNQDGTLYYVDIPIVALEEGEDFNVAAGGITTMEAEPAGVANVTNLFGVADGADRETNTELIDRIKVAVTVRALVTGRGIVVTLTENFPSIEEIFPIGFGDPEMMRDIVYNTHIGGNADVYVKTPNFVAGFKDIFGLEVDTTRRVHGKSTVVTLVQDIAYFMGQAPIDRTDFVPIVKTIDDLYVYVEGSDYTIVDDAGAIARIAASNIFHIANTAGNVTTTKILSKVGGFVGVRRDMILTIDLPASVAGTYTIKEHIDDDNVEIYGTFPVGLAAGVSYQVDDMLSIEYEYNPVTVDIIAEPRSTERTDYTITDVPVMYIDSVQVLDPLSGEPTGVEIVAGGGFGWGGFGMGGFGVGSGSSYRLLVNEPTLRHSQREDVYLEFAASYVGYAVRINYLYANAVPPIQSFMDDRNNQSTTASLLARHFIPVFVDGQVVVVYDIPAATSTTAITVDEMTTILKDFITDIDSGEDLELSDLVDVLYDNGASRVDLSTLAKLRGEVHNHDGTVEFRVPDDAGSMTIPDDEIPDPTDKPLSPRIARFLARDITLQRNVV
jgi:hypothetical protein